MGSLRPLPGQSKDQGHAWVHWLVHAIIWGGVIYSVRPWKLLCMCGCTVGG